MPNEGLWQDRFPNGERSISPIASEIARFTVSEEAGPQDIVIPEFDASPFGAAAKTIGQMLERYHAWSARVYINDSFPDHTARRSWRAERRSDPRFFQEDLDPIQRWEKRNEYRMAPISGLWALFEALNMRLGSGTSEDKTFAEQLSAQWPEQEYLALYEHYEQKTNKEKQRINAEFGRKYARLLERIAREASQRKMAAI